MLALAQLGSSGEKKKQNFATHFVSFYLNWQIRLLLSTLTFTPP